MPALEHRHSLLCPAEALQDGCCCCVCCFLRLCSAPHIIQSQLQEVLGAVVYADFPDAWPGLLDTIMGHLTSNVSSSSRQQHIHSWQRSQH
jgi:hypothetical protein